MTAAKNTDRELFRESDDFCAPSLHVTEGGSIGMKVGGLVIVKSIREWHAIAVGLIPQKMISDALKKA